MVNCLIGHTIIEKNVIIGDNCSIDQRVIIRNTILKNNIRVLDNCVIGKRFWFFPKTEIIIDFLKLGLF